MIYDMTLVSFPQPSSFYLNFKTSQLVTYFHHCECQPYAHDASTLNDSNQKNSMTWGSPGNWGHGLNYKHATGHFFLHEKNKTGDNQIPMMLCN